MGNWDIMKRIFLDVGAHHGQTIEMILLSRFKVDDVELREE
jgi:hypothetical protein